MADDDPTIFRRTPRGDEAAGPPDPVTQFRRTGTDSPARRVSKEQAALSWPAYIGQTAYDTIAGINRGFYGGFAPRFAGKVGEVTGEYPPGTGTERALANQAIRDERSPWASSGGKLAGGVAQGVTAGKVLPIGTAIASRAGGSLPARIGGYGVEGALLGGANAASEVFSGNPMDYITAGAKGAAPGFVFGGIGGSLVPKSAVTMRPGDPRTGQPLQMPEDKLQAITDAGYRQFRAIPATYSSKAFLNYLTNIEDKLIKAGANDETAKQVYATLKTLRQGGFGGSGGNITPQGIELAIRSLNGAKNVSAAGTQAAGTGASILREGLHDFVQNPPAGAVTSRGTHAQDAARIIEQARSNYAALARSREVSDTARNAANVAATGGEAVAPQLVRKGNEMRAWENGKQPNLQGWQQEGRDQLAAAITPTLPEKVANSVARSLPQFPVSTQIADALQGYSSAGIARRWNELAEAQRQTSNAFQRDVARSVPVPGPGMGAVAQGVQGGLREGLATPYADGRDAIAHQYLQELMR